MHAPMDDARLRVKHQGARPGRRQTAQRTRGDRTNGRCGDARQAAGRQAVGVTNGRCGDARTTSSRLGSSIRRRSASGDLAPNRPVGMQKSGAQRANRTTKPPRAAAHGSIDLRQPTAP